MARARLSLSRHPLAEADARRDGRYLAARVVPDNAAVFLSAEHGLRDRVVLTGDLDIAPLPTDVWNHKLMSRRIGHTPHDIAAMERLRRLLNWIDAVREAIPPEDPVFNWWSYRQTEFKIDSKGWRPPSDRAPVMVTLRS